MLQFPTDAALVSLETIPTISRNLIGLFPKISVSDWLSQHDNPTTRIELNDRKVERLFTKIQLQLFSYWKNSKRNDDDLAAKHPH